MVNETKAEDAGFDIGIPPLWRSRDVNGNPRNRLAAELYAMTSDDRAARIDHLRRQLSERNEDLSASEDAWRQCVEKLEVAGQHASRLSLDGERLQYTSRCTECAEDSVEPASWPSMEEARALLRTLGEQRVEVLRVKRLLKEMGAAAD